MTKTDSLCSDIYWLFSGTKDKREWGNKKKRKERWVFALQRRVAGGWSKSIRQKPNPPPFHHILCCRLTVIFPPIVNRSLQINPSSVDVWCRCKSVLLQLLYDIKLSVLHHLLYGIDANQSFISWWMVSTIGSAFPFFSLDWDQVDDVIRRIIMVCSFLFSSMCVYVCVCVCVNVLVNCLHVSISCCFTCNFSVEKIFVLELLWFQVFT